MENNEKNSIQETKDKYNILKEKYALPEWDELNKEFGIEKIDSESELILRQIIHLMADRIQNYMRFMENLLNPSNASIFTFSIVKILDISQRTILSEAYKQISEIEIDLIKIDLKSSEESESNFIKKTFDKWKLIKEDLYKIISFVENNWESKPEQSKKDYFG